MIGSIIIFLVIGLIAGLIARAIMPGRQSMGLVATTLLGCAGSIVGGFIGSLFHRGEGVFSPAGIIGSVLGALLVLFLVGLAQRGRRRVTV
ncbi:MAG: GlsB/YeaQ/YmgE family stress response membrane protein [Myxococcaceae bacterium]|nr:GlsB/YeaQ/YmgE family stress response membrane protein [Myxococcaceae bacterium]